MSAFNYVYGLKRAISAADEQAVGTYFYRTADTLNIARPLSANGWYEVKTHLRALYAEGFPETLAPEDREVHMLACSDLAIDPVPEAEGLEAQVLNLMLWLGSPADRHGTFGEVVRVVTLTLLSFTMGSVGLLVAHLFGYPLSLEIFGIGVYAFLCLCVLFISTNTNVGVFGLCMLSFGVFRLTQQTWDIQGWSDAIKPLAICGLSGVGGLVFLLIVRR